jgi:hypothetical protein
MLTKTRTEGGLPGGGVRLVGSPCLSPAPSPRESGTRKARATSGESVFTNGSSERGGGVRLDPETPSFQPQKHHAAPSISTNESSSGGSSTTGHFPDAVTGRQSQTTTPGITEPLASDKSTPKASGNGSTPDEHRTPYNLMFGSSIRDAASQAGFGAAGQQVANNTNDAQKRRPPALRPLPFRVQEAKMGFGPGRLPPAVAIHHPEVHSQVTDSANNAPVYTDNRGAMQSANGFHGPQAPARLTHQAVNGTPHSGTANCHFNPAMALVHQQQVPGNHPVAHMSLAINRPSVVGTSILAQIEGTAGQQVKDARSHKLNALTSSNGGHPTFETVMSEEYFPFYLGVDRCQPHNFGVVKIKNVSSQPPGWPSSPVLPSADFVTARSHTRPHGPRS